MISGTPMTKAAPIRLFVALAALDLVAVCAAPKEPPDPNISSIYPIAAQRGTALVATLRGVNLANAQSLMLDGEELDAHILSVSSEQAPAGEEAPKGRPVDLLQVRIAVPAEARIGPHDLRAVTPLGVSNKVALHVTAEHVLSEAEAELPLKKFPVVINGRIAHPGDTNSWPIEVAVGETLTFEASSFGNSFDPSLVLFEPTGSWFDPGRLNQVASNDEPLFFPGLSTDARLVERFPHSGRYVLRVQGFHGQGGADCVYQLRIMRGETPLPLLHPAIRADWEERQFTRNLTGNRMQELAARGAADPNAGPMGTFRGVPEDAKEIPVMKTPGVVEGRIDQPGKAHIIHLQVDKPQQVAIEVQTPEATLPRFNPVVRLMEPGGREIATDVYTKLNNNGLYMMKMIEAKTTVNLTATGEYTIQIRDITTSGAGSDFLYRVVVRPQVPHVGKIEVADDRVNLAAGSSHPLAVTIDREEGFGGYVAFDVEGLTAGVTVLPALEDYVEALPLPNGGRVERYIAKQQKSVLLLAAADTAQLTAMPVRVRLVARLVRDGHLSDPIASKELLLMVISPGKS